ncbi:MAG: LCP family glycopolymer transferase [Candidatus Villigracilaceae bacterium]
MNLHPASGKPHSPLLFLHLSALILLLLSLTGCQSSAAAATIPPARRPYVLVTAPVNATATPTPFQPLAAMNNSATLQVFSQQTPLPEATLAAPTPTSLPVLPSVAVTPSLREYPTPQIQPTSIEIPPPSGLLSRPPNQVNILLLGSDKRPYSSIYRTDTIILATLNQDTGSIHLTAIPRDLYVYIPGWTMQRINTAMAHGGFEQLALTFEYNLGLQPDYFVMVNFQGFIAIVDSLGGIDVQVAQPLYDTRTGYGWFYVPSGQVHMDGEMALWYVRSRHTSNDIDRLRRAEEVVLAIGSRLMDFDALSRLPDFYNLYKDRIATNITLEDALRLAPAARQAAQNNRIQSFVLGYGPLYDWVEPFTGAMVLLPKQEQVLALMSQALSAP